MLSMLLKNISRGSMTVRFPQRPPASAHYRGLVQFDSKRCTGCSMCAFRCTSRAITFRSSKTEYKWSYDPGQCTYCAACVDGCESHALSMEEGCPPVYFSASALKSSYTMQRTPPPAGRPAAKPVGGTQ